MLPSTVKDVFEQFRKVLNMMVENGVLKSFTFIYEEGTPFLAREKFLINTVNILDEIKRSLLKLHAEFNEWQKENISFEQSLELLVPITSSSSSVGNVTQELVFSHNAEGNQFEYTVPNIPHVSISSSDIFQQCDKDASPFTIQFVDAVSFLESSDWSTNPTLIPVLEASSFDQLTCDAKFGTDNSQLTIVNNSVQPTVDEFAPSYMEPGASFLHTNEDEPQEDAHALLNLDSKQLNPESRSCLEQDLNGLTLTENHLEPNLKPELNAGCNEKFSLDNLQEGDDNICDDVLFDIFSCDHCGELFPNKRKLALHITVRHGESTTNECSECGKQFTRKTALDVHLDIHRGIKPFKCPVCWKTFSQKVSLDSHILGHAGFYKFSCDECGKSFPTKAKLNFHIKCHKSGLQECMICFKKFSTASYLAVHQKNHEREVLKVPCFVCNALFRSNQKVEEHLSLEHPGVRIPCSYAKCSQSFTSYGSLRQHIKGKHENIDKVPCKICGKDLSSQRCFVRHMRNVHDMNDTGTPLVYYCGTCNKKFFSKSSLKTHMDSRHIQKATKENIQCYECGCRFKSSHSLSLHMRAHEGKFRFKCDVCSKQFVRRCHYNSHMVTHSSERPFKCTVCPSMFKVSKHLRSHMKRVHKSTYNLESLLKQFSDDNDIPGDNLNEFNYIPSIANEVEFTEVSKYECT